MLNRSRLCARIEESIRDAGAASTGVLLLRVERFHELCGLVGHAMGDAIAEHVLQRLSGALRERDVLLPIGNCDVAVILSNLLSPNHAALAAQRLLREFDLPFELDGRSLKLRAHVGFSVCPLHGAQAQDLCRGAERALAIARASGQGWAMADESEDEAALYQDLRHALIENLLHVHFQPVIELKQGRLVGVEALARWDCPRRGMVRPDRFITLAEQTGLADELTRWSVNAALREHARLRALEPTLRCSINLSSKAFPQVGLVEQLLDAVALWDTPPDSVVLEVTETAMMEDPDLSARVLQRLDRGGMRIAIDDFGKGHSSLAYLKHFPVRELKIDQSFVIDAETDSRSARLVGSMVELAHHLGMEAVAEGIETEGAANLLREMGCDRAQGYHLGRPMPTEQLLDLLRKTA
jgi:diguanylate cyclase